MDGAFEIMKLSEIYLKIIKSEPYNDLSVFTDKYDSYEEYPVISRYKKAEYLKKFVSPDGVFQMLISIANFVLNSAMVYARRNLDKTNGDILFAIYFCGFNGYKENLFVVPRIFVFPGAAGLDFLHKLVNSRGVTSSPEMTLIKKNFEEMGIASNFNFYESRFFDEACGEELVHIYAIPVALHPVEQGMARSGS
ncbi:Imm15 family immunity protein [Achromobacter spanius]|uniref:Imm15 family immunity protein n=1 Tax=Achromobacter spanius TaxID=217203 RepID=UPI00320BAB51